MISDGERHTRTFTREVSITSPVTAEMPARLGKHCGNGPQLCLNIQNAFDLWRAQHTLAAELDEMPTRAAA